MENDNIVQDKLEINGAGSENENPNNVKKEEELNQNNTKILKNRKWKFKKIIKIITYIVVLLLIWIATIQYMSADKYDAVVNVLEQNEKVGINPTSDKLDYGDLPKGKRMSRSIIIENNGDMNIYVMILKTGNISELIEISKNNFVLNSGDNEKIELPLELPISANKDKYDGKIIIFKIPKLL